MADGCGAKLCTQPRCREEDGSREGSLRDCGADEHAVSIGAWEEDGLDVCPPHCLSPTVQERAICKIVELMSKHAAQEPRTLFVMGSYRIGKERAYLGAAKALGYRCHVNADKLRVSAPALLHPSVDT